MPTHTTSALYNSVTYWAPVMHYLYTNVAVDSSSRFSFRARTHTRTPTHTQIHPQTKLTIQVLKSTVHRLPLPSIIIIVWFVQWTLPFPSETSPCLTCQFCARWEAVARPMLTGATSDSTVWSQVWRGRPNLWFQSLGKGATLDLSTQLWSMDGSARAMWRKNLRRVVRTMCVSGGWVTTNTTQNKPRALHVWQDLKQEIFWGYFHSRSTCRMEYDIFLSKRALSTPTQTHASSTIHPSIPILSNNRLKQLWKILLF